MLEDKEQSNPRATSEELKDSNNEAWTEEELHK